jgi:hypothetical protein
MILQPSHCHRSFESYVKLPSVSYARLGPPGNYHVLPPNRRANADVLPHVAFT